MVAHGIGQQQQQALTNSALQGWALGETDFVEELQKRTARRVSKAKAGRPVRQSKARAKNLSPNKPGG
jgi:putative transposase